MEMAFDIVIPDNNENEFIEIAIKLGIKKLYFLYDYEKLPSRQIENGNVDIEYGFLAGRSLNQAIKKTKIIVAKASDKDRLYIESKKVKLIYGFEESSKREFIHQRASGLNHILLDLAKKNNLAIGFSYGMFFQKSPEARSVLMGRMMQNIMLCRKYKSRTMVGCFSNNPYHLRAPSDIASLFKVLGMESGAIKKSQNYIL